MAEEGTLGLARVQNSGDDDVSKAELQRRMDDARESISQTVTEIKDTVVHQYETVKDTISETLDWREQFKKRPVAWAAGAVGAGFLTGYCITSMIKGDGQDYDRYTEGYEQARRDYQPDLSQGYAPKPLAAGFTSPVEPDETEGRPGLLERLQDTPAFDRVRTEASSLSNQLFTEVAKTAKEIVIPAAVGWVRHWLEGMIPQKGSATVPGSQTGYAGSESRQNASRTGYQPVTERNQ